MYVMYVMYVMHYIHYIQNEPGSAVPRQPQGAGGVSGYRGSATRRRLWVEIAQEPGGSSSCMEAVPGIDGKERKAAVTHEQQCMHGMHGMHGI